MKNKSYCNQGLPLRVIKLNACWSLYLAAIFFLICAPLAQAGDAPQWMHALVNAPLPAHDEKTDTVLMYSEKTVNVQSTDKIKTTVREAYKILRPSGRDAAIAHVSFNAHIKISYLHGWCIPVQGKDYEIKDKDGVEVALTKIVGSELITDVRTKVINIPGADVGSIVGYEYEEDEQPMVLQDTWYFQQESPVRESHYSLQLPNGWEYRTFWINYPEVKAVAGANNLWQWSVTDIKEIRPEQDMPPIAGVVSSMVVSFFPPGGPSVNGFASWQQMGAWYRNLTTGRLDASPETKQKVATLTASATTPLDKMKAIAEFVQKNIRYVAIELGIGGWQPHAANEVFSHRYGDCKDKATLTSSMLHEIGIESFYVIINTHRGAVTPDTPAHVGGFNHAILAIRIPDGANSPSLAATIQHPRLGKLLFFDPTNELTPFGEIGGYLQQNWGLLVTPEGGELVELPRQAPAMNGIQRTAKLTLDPSGTLRGDVSEVRLGGRAWDQRGTLLSVTQASDRIKPIETLLADSLSTFSIAKAEVVNLHQTDQPFGFNYSFEAINYAKNAGGLLLVRPRVLGRKGSGIMETKEPRHFPIEFDEPVRDTDTFEITLPAGYEVDDLPPPVDVDYGYANYHSKTVLTGNVLRYSRAFEVKDLSVPVSKADELKKFYRIIAGDERSTAVLKPAAK
jgi:hypothetical protein